MGVSFCRFSGYDHIWVKAVECGAGIGASVLLAVMKGRRGGRSKKYSFILGCDLRRLVPPPPPAETH